MVSTPRSSNLVEADEQREFYVWIDPNSFLVQHNAGLVGVFIGGPITGLDSGVSKLAFLPNPDFKAHLSPFHLGIAARYRTEYNLEIFRLRMATDYPSRLDALFLLDSVDEACRYGEAHTSHVEGRVLKRVRSRGAYRYSLHDSGWIDFLNGPGSVDEGTIDAAADHYWRGQRVPGEFSSMGQKVTCPSVRETLFYGHVHFPNRDLHVTDA